MNRMLLTLLFALSAGCTTRSPLPAPRSPLTDTVASAVPAQPHLVPVKTAHALPEIKQLRLPNGFTVHVMERRDFPHVALSYVNERAGEDAPTLEDAGLASLINQTVLVNASDEHSKSKASGEQGQDGAQGQGDVEPSILLFRLNTKRHSATISTRVGRDDTGSAIRALAEIAREPHFTDELLTLAKKRVKSLWDDERYDARGVSRSYVLQRIYGPNHVLGQHSEWAVKHVDGIELARVKSGYEARYVPSASALIVVGDVKSEQVLRTVQKAFGDWQTKADPPPRYEPSDWEPRGKRKVFVMDYGARLSMIALGQRALAPSDPRFAAQDALVHILGGSFASRLMTTLRAKEGLTYGVTATLHPRRDGSTILIESAVPCDAAQKATSAIVRELEGLQQTPVLEAELARARSALVQAQLARYETTAGALSALEDALELGEDPATRARRYVEAVDAITVDAVHSVARDVLQPQKAPIVIVGDTRNGSELGDWADDDDEML